MKFSPIIAAGIVSMALAGSAFAAGGGDDDDSTNTTKECSDGQVWDKAKKKCVDASRGMYDDDFIFENARELAYDGQYEHAINLLKLAANQDDPRILNFLGYSSRKSGNVELAMTYYQKALSINPDYNLARSYMGQALVLEGDMDGAWTQLAEIASRGGKGTDAYYELKQAIAGTITY